MTDAWDEEDRAIARALGVEAPEHDAGPIDADAVAEYETVLAAIPFESVEPGSGLENEVVAAALARRPAAAVAIGRGPVDRKIAPRRRSVSPRWIAIGGAVAAAAAIAVALAVGGTANGPSSPGGRIAPAAATGSVARVLSQPGTRTGVLHTAAGATTGRVALGRDGQGFLYDLAPAVSSAPARWLWLETGSDQLLVGRLGNGSTVHFVVRGAVDAVGAVLVTTENGTPTTPGPARSTATLKSKR